MVVIITNQLDVRAIFRDVFIKLTKHMGNMNLLETGEPITKEKDRYIVFVNTKGVFLARIICILDKKLGQDILTNMVHGRKLLPEEQELYLKEYVNIICGNALTQINSQKKAASRLTVPAFSEEESLLEKEMEMQNESIVFQGNSGCIEVRISYVMES